MFDSRAVILRREQDAIEDELGVVAPSGYMAVADDDPRRCPEAGLGKLHDIRRDSDDVIRCANCRKDAKALLQRRRNAA